MSIPYYSYVGGSVPLTLKPAHIRIKSVYIAKIPAIRITGSSPNFASRHSEAGFRGIVFSGNKFRGLYLKTTDYTHSHACLYTVVMWQCWCDCYDGIAGAAGHKFSVMAATRTYLRCPPRVLIISPISISAR